MSSQPTPDFEIDPQLGPFYMTHGEEFIPAGFEESVERLAETLGNYQVFSNEPSLTGQFSIGHYDLTRYIQEEWDRLTADVTPDNRPRKGFLLSSKSPSQAAGRAAEDVLLKKILWRLTLNGIKAERVLDFWDALDEKLIVRPRGVASDDLVIQLSDNSLVLVESKASFRPASSPTRYLTKAALQMQTALLSNAKAAYALFALINLSLRTVNLILLDREEALSENVSRLVANLVERGKQNEKREFKPLQNLIELGVPGLWAGHDDGEDSTKIARNLREKAWKRTG